jgi:hypothetical protein
MIVNYASSIVNKLEALLTDDTRVIIYNRHVFIVQASGHKLLLEVGNNILMIIGDPQEILDLQLRPHLILSSYCIKEIIVDY